MPELMEEKMWVIQLGLEGGTHWMTQSDTPMTFSELVSALEQCIEQSPGSVFRGHNIQGTL